MIRRLATVRARTTVAACLVVAVTLLLSASVFVFVMRRSLEGNLLDNARARANDLALLMQETRVPALLPDSGEKGAVVQVVHGDGRVLAGSAQITPGSRLSAVTPALGQTQTENLSTLPITGDQRGDPFRVLAFGAQTRGGPITVYVALSLDQVEENVAAVRQILLFFLPGLLAAVGVTSWYFVGRALRPVDAITHEVADIGEGDLSRRVPEPRSDDEIGRLARGMNRMLQRLQSATERQRRFVADASHELQSPLAASLADLEVALADPQARDWRETASALVSDNHRMSRLVRDLLFLANSDGGAAPRPRTPVDLDDLVLTEVTRLRLRVPATIDTTRVLPVEICANPDQLSRVVANLLENASRYAISMISVELGRDAASAVLVVEDDGPGIPDVARDRVFERFARLDDSRSRGTGGSGLGLAIAREIVESHGGTIVVEQRDRGARFVVRLPAIQ